MLLEDEEGEVVTTITPSVQNPDGGTATRPRRVGLGDDGKSFAIAFRDRSTRLGFIRRVYAIVTAQLLVAALVSLRFADLASRAGGSDIVALQQTSAALIAPSVLGALACSWAFGVSERARRERPLNYILLTIFTLCQSVIVGALTTFFETRSVVQAAIGTGAAMGSLTLWALQPTPARDLTARGSHLVSGLFALLAVGLLNMVWPTSSVLHTARSAFGALLLSAFLVHDTQMIVGGRHRKYQLREDEHVHASVALFSDVTGLFVKLLELFGERRVGGGGRRRQTGRR